MDTASRQIIVGNWKMNGVTTDLAEIEKVAWEIADCPGEVVICPPTTLLHAAARMTAGSRLLLGAQDCSEQAEGAFTGDISARMIVDCRGRFVILGHSERRQYHGETDLLVRRKAEIALNAGLAPVICIGETETERLSQETLAVLTKQLRDGLPEDLNDGRLIIAYEPLWAIGTGRIPDYDEIIAAHSAIRHALVGTYGPSGSKVPILYGGSVKPENAAQILCLENVDGVLVGGASLRAGTFLQICNAVAQ
ncbi:triose-phosphate isomerase (plasmid) [Agrobacterium deltaense]|uniref:triose-phosphate isomerase n=1 Tax=Agrobacterium deltaense TaxID=1183412 RepID=UPI003D98879C